MSSTTEDLEVFRRAASEVLLGADILPRIQEYLPPDHRQLATALREAIADCDAVICLVGKSFGAAPSAQPGCRRSYTQIEYDVARQLGNPIYVFLTSDELQCGRPSTESADDLALQHRHRLQLLEQHKCEFFSSIDGLKLRVAQLLPRLTAVHTPRVRYLNPPASPASFAGRVQELGELRSALVDDGSSIVLVCGLGGQGKTALVAELLRRRHPLPFSAVLWCTLIHEQHSLDWFLDEALLWLAAAYYRKGDALSVQARTKLLLDVCQDEAVLLVLDGLERWLRGWSRSDGPRLEAGDTVDYRRGHFEGVDELLRAMSGLTAGTRLVATTRACPAALDDVACSVIGASGARDPSFGLPGLDTTAAVELLRALGVKGMTEALADVAHAYANHPLALTVLAGLLRQRHGGRIDRLPEVTALDPGRRLFALLEEMRKSLPGAPASEDILRVAALCLDDAPLPAVAVALGETAPAAAVLRDHAVTLSDWSLMTWDFERQTIRLHPLVREHFGNLTGSEEARRIHERLAAWYEAQPVADDACTLEGIRSRVLAIEHGLRASDTARGFALCFEPIAQMSSLVDWCRAWGHLATGIDVLGRVAAAAPLPSRPELLIARAGLQRLEGRLDTALEDVNTAIDLLERDGTPAPGTLADALVTRGNIRWQGSAALEHAASDYRRALDLLPGEPLEGVEGRAQAAGIRLNLSVVLREMGRLHEAGQEARLVVEMYRGLVSLEASCAPMLAQSLLHAANVQADRGDAEDALPMLREALDILAPLVAGGRSELVPSLAHAHVLAAAVLSDTDRHEEALAEARQAVGLLHDLTEGGRRDLEWLEAVALLGRGAVLGRMGRWEEAHAEEDAAVAMLRRLVADTRPDVDAVLAHALMNRAEALYALGNRDASFEDRDEALAVMRRLVREGNYEARVLLVRKSTTLACAFLRDDPIDAAALLTEAADEGALGLARNEAEEALRVELDRALRRLSKEGIPGAGGGPLETVVARIAAMVARKTAPAM